MKPKYNTPKEQHKFVVDISSSKTINCKGKGPNPFVPQDCLSPLNIYIKKKKKNNQIKQAILNSLSLVFLVH